MREYRQQYPDLFPNNLNAQVGSLHGGRMQRDVLIPIPKAPKEPMPEWKEIVDPLLHGKELRSGFLVEKEVFRTPDSKLDVSS